MFVNKEDYYYYITVMNENYAQPEMPKGCEEGIISGMYRLQTSQAKQHHVQLLGSGAILREVITAADGEEGVEKAKAENPDLILMDVMMPKMDGYTAVEKIKTEMNPAPLVMMLTAKGTEDDVMQGLVGGADDYITKPFAPRELIARVKVALIKAGHKEDLPE